MSKLGKRYQCPACQTMILCLRPGPSNFQCCQADMEEVEMEELPSGD